MGSSILVLDGDRKIADAVARYLENENFQVTKCHRAGEALEQIEKEQPDMLLLDVMLPDMDGLTVLQKIREKYTFPVILLTEKREYADKINGLMLGADDYVAKPFNPLELVARVKAQIRRSTKYNVGEHSGDSVLACNGLFLNRSTHECVYNGKELSLTPIEFDILWLLTENRGQVISSEQLFEQVWKEKYYKNSNNTVMVHIRHLREKMSDPNGKSDFIKTVWGVGYRVEK